MKGLVVTGTDTGVGKTLVSTVLLTLLRERGFSPAALKPCETGCAPDSPEDALAMREASGANDPLDDVCPYRFRAALAPAEAARLEGRRVELPSLFAAYERLSRDGRPVIVESAGGALVPLNEEATFGDLAARLGLPCVVVARDALGTLNHTALTVEALRRRGIPVRGVVLNALTPADDGTRASNAEWIARQCGVEILAQLSFHPDRAERLSAGLRAMGRKFDLLFGSR